MGVNPRCDSISSPIETFKGIRLSFYNGHEYLFQMYNEEGRIRESRNLWISREEIVSWSIFLKNAFQRPI